MGVKITAQQRQLSLILAMTLPDRPLSKNDLFKQVLGYRGEPVGDSLERMFSRDKKALETAGCQIVISRNSRQEECYRIVKPERSWEEDFTAGERELLKTAMGLWNNIEGSGSLKVRALGTGDLCRDDGLRVPHSGLSDPHLLAQILPAIWRRQRVQFSYPQSGGAEASATRVVEPWRLLVSDSQILLHGWDCQRQAERHFKLAHLGADFTVLDEVATAERDLSTQLSVTQIEPLIAAPKGNGSSLRGRAVALEEAPAGMPEAAAGQWQWWRGHPDSYRHWWQLALSQADECVVVEPAILRQDVLASLEHIAQLGKTAAASSAAKGKAKRGRKARGPAPARGAGKRSNLELTLALLRWLQTSGAHTVDEAANHFEVSRTEIERVVQYLSETFFDEDYYWTKINLRWDLLDEEDVLALDVRTGVENIAPLTTTEARAALVALWLYTRLAPQSHHDQLLSAVAKLAPQAGMGHLEEVLIWVESERDQHLRAVVAQARDEHRQVEFDYVSSSGRTSKRRVFPFGLVYYDGHWVLRGYCYDAGQQRHFKSDGISELQLGAPVDEVPVDAGGTEPTGRHVQVEVEPTWRWALTEQRWRGRASGSFYLNVYDTRWGSDQLLILGRGLRSCDDLELLESAAARAAAGLRHYQCFCEPADH